MANTQGDVDLRKSPPPVRTLAWLVFKGLNMKSKITNGFEQVTSCHRSQETVPAYRLDDRGVVSILGIGKNIFFS